jgi:hypothetical protein
MRSTRKLVLAAALLAPGCAAPRVVPAAAVAAPAPAPVEPEAKRPPAPEAPPSCTRPGASFSGDKWAPKALTAEREKQLAEADAYVRDHPTPAGPREKAELAENKYARARAFFEAHRWAESAIAFREIAVDHADAEVGVYASQLYLESINVLGAQAEPARPICYEEMGRDVPLFLTLYCNGAAAQKNAEQCTILHKIQRDIDRLSAEKLVRRGEAGDGDSAALYAEAGSAYLALARRCVDEAHAAGSPPQQERCDEIAHNAGRAFIAAGHPERAAEAAKILLDPRNGMQHSPLAVKLAKILAATP